MDSACVPFQPYIFGTSGSLYMVGKWVFTPIYNSIHYTPFFKKVTHLLSNDLLTYWDIQVPLPLHGTAATVLKPTLLIFTKRNRYDVWCWLAAGEHSYPQIRWAKNNPYSLPTSLRDCQEWFTEIYIQTGCHAEPGACYIILTNLALEVGMRGHDWLWLYNLKLINLLYQWCPDKLGAKVSGGKESTSQRS